MNPASLQPEPVKAICKPLRRWAFGLTGRTITLLAAGFVLLIPGFWYGPLSYSMLIWDALVLLFAWWDGARLPEPEELKSERRWLNAPALDSKTEIEIAIENRSRLILDCRIEDDLAPALLREPAVHRVTAFPHVPATFRYSVEPQERGDWEMGGLYVRYRSVLGLVERWSMANLAQGVRVYPELRTTGDQQIFLARSRQIDLQLRQAQQRGLGRDFESLRDYREGDDLRDICWTATARRGSPITRQYQTERSQPVWIVLDCGRLMRARIGCSAASLGSADGNSRVGSRGHSKLDYASSTAVALAQLALYSGDRVGLMAYGQGIQQRLLPGRGSAHLRQMIEMLAQVKPETSEADHLRATAVLNRLQPRRSLILWITDLAETAMRPEVIDGAAQLLKRHLLLFVAMGQPEVERIAAKPPETLEEMFRAAAAQEMAGRREVLLARLQEQGALTLDLNPEALTATVLNHYLMVKERAMV
jgi:uncharacterized protein (DUF58 family)